MSKVELTMEQRVQAINDFINWTHYMGNVAHSKGFDGNSKLIDKRQAYAFKVYADANGAAETYLEYELRQPIDGDSAPANEIADYEQYRDTPIEANKTIDLPKFVFRSQNDGASE